MRTILAIIAALSMGAFVLATADAAPKGPSGTIAVGAGSVLAYGGTVTFDTTHDGFKGYQYPMVYVACYQGADLVYGQLDYPGAEFVMGGGSSLWVTLGGGPAECVATLRVYGDKDDGGAQYILGTIAFSASGGE